MTQAQLIEKANEAYDKAVSAQQSGNWAAYGTYLDQLHNYLTQLAEGAGSAADDTAIDTDTADAEI